MTRGRPRPDLRITPEPSERDREAIALALARAPRPAATAGPRSAWWREGVAESLAPPAPPGPTQRRR